MTPQASAGSIPQRPFDWPTLIANKDKEIARLEASTPPMWKNPAPASSRPARCSRMPTRFGSANGEDGQGQIRADRDRRRSQSRAGDPGHRARDLVERSVSSAGTAQAHRHPGRRLYRAGVCRHLRGLRHRRHRDLSRRQHPARLRRGRPHPCARRDGAARHHHSHRLHRQQDRQARQGIHHASVERFQHRFRAR